MASMLLVGLTTDAGQTEDRSGDRVTMIKQIRNQRIRSIALGLGVGAAALALGATAASAQATLANVKQKGFLQCGSNTGLAGFGVPDAQGNWTGLDVDYCRAIAAAMARQ